MKHQEKIIKVTDQFLPELLAGRFKEIRKCYVKNPETLLEDFFETLKILFEDTKRKQDEGKKGKVAYIYFSFLYSNVLLNRHGYRVETLDGQFYLDDCEISGMWCPKLIFDYLEEDVQIIRRKIQGEYIPLSKYDLLELRNSHLHSYYSCAFSYLKEFISGIALMKSFKYMDKEDNVKIIFGEYMDMYTCIGEISGKEQK